MSAVDPTAIAGMAAVDPTAIAGMAAVEDARGERVIARPADRRTASLANLRQGMSRSAAGTSRSS